MKSSKKFRVRLLVLIAGASLGFTGLAGDASAGTQVGASVSFSGTRTTVVEPVEEHVCTYEQRPVTRTYTDASGGSYEHRTYETVRVCTHAPKYYPEVASTKVYKETRPKARKERRRYRQTNYSVGVGYYGGSPSLRVGVGYRTSTYNAPYTSYYRPYPSHHYGYYGNHYSHHAYNSYGHHGYSSYGHHAPYSSLSLNFGHGGSHHASGHHSSGHHGHH